MFFKLMLERLPSDSQRKLQNFTHALWMGSDVVPVRPKWIDAIVAASRAADFWMMGNVFRGKGYAKKRHQATWFHHPDAHSIYKLHDSQFQTFLRMVEERQPPSDGDKSIDLSIDKTLNDFTSGSIHDHLNAHFLHGTIIRDGCQESDAQPTDDVPEEAYLVYDCPNGGKYGTAADNGVVVYHDEIRPSHQLSVVITCEEHELALAALALESAKKHIPHSIEFIAVVSKPVAVKAKQKLPSFTTVKTDDDMQYHKHKFSAILNTDRYAKGHFILHLHPDSVLFRQLLYKELFFLSRPLVQYSRYDNLLLSSNSDRCRYGKNPCFGGSVNQSQALQAGISDILKRPVDYEFSLSNYHMNLYPREVYRSIRRHLKSLHDRKSINQIFLEQEGSSGLLTIPDTIFNLIGAYLYYHSPQSVSWNYVGNRYDADALSTDPAFRVNRPPVACYGYGPQAYDYLEKQKDGGDSSSPSPYDDLIQAVRLTLSSKKVRPQACYCKEFSKKSIPVSY